MDGASINPASPPRMISIGMAELRIVFAARRPKKLELRTIDDADMKAAPMQKVDMTTSNGV
ncbi:hypothetical protein KIN_08720 [Litoreibacter roseus]|uniref:Uncharacterized protein n=1 Tax=Litoreibacter roseus TaxID=2601869 RepID=A0A6N6JES0_9RHOB|nr:hypothetical protein KIN_08720 [Litoreibacter roseus]